MHIVLSNNFQQSFLKIKGWNRWIQFLFYFFLEHCLKTLNKEEYNLTHVNKNTHGLAYVAFSNISSRLWSGDKTIFDAFCQSKKSIKFSFRLIIFYYFKDFSVFSKAVFFFSIYTILIKFELQLGTMQCG